ncbi:substrate-binding domain-containing protein [Paenibacillus aceris]|uniref:Ribose transport system substrate-binding protein n=1 Tax=Paenibacillus aceris TaxID=869555 RepID=A0ABS4HVY8_9BACL|nr:substrate-binding domain-containing protein [Paenibacillus aceris]MBP1962807.1 ribose transport system substrate-binding protein [Paenibacillus aceris]NHW38237.1 substrate-binding domain-containing protein [Paenibacillus aceris]
MKKLVLASVLTIMMTSLFTACGSSTTTTSTSSPMAKETAAASTAAPSAAPAASEASKPKKSSYLIGMSQANLGEPWRVTMNAQIADAAKKYPDFKVVYADAAQDNSKQIADVENFIQQKVDLLIISPNEAKPLTAVVKKAYDAGIPVITLDRRVEGDSFTQHIGADNVIIGKGIGEWVAKTLGDKGGNVVEIKGLEGTSGQKERHDGFMEGIKSNPNIKIIAAQNADWLRDKAISVMEGILQANKKIDVVFGHNDPMAEGAYTAAKNAGREKEMLFVGADGLPTPDGSIKSILAGRLNATYVYPTGGQEAIDNAHKLLTEGAKLEKQVILGTQEINKDNAAEMLKKYGGQ